MMEHIIDELLEQLSLSRANLIYSGGGHCYLLVPNTVQSKKIIQRKEEETNQWLLDTYGIALYVAGGYAECSANDLKNNPKAGDSMKLVHINLNEGILVDAINCTEWVIESPEYFSEYVMELAGQVEGKEGRFVLSDNEKEVDISKNVELIFNIFALDINERKLISKLYMELEKLTADERFYVKTQEMKQYLQEYLLQLEQETDYILDLADEIDFASLFKAFGIKYEVLEENFLERLVRYMRIVERLLKKKLFVFVNLRSYLSNQQIDELIKEATYQEIQLLLIETCARDCIEGVTRYIIDKDGCEI